MSKKDAAKNNAQNDSKNDSKKDAKNNAKNNAQKGAKDDSKDAPKKDAKDAAKDAPKNASMIDKKIGILDPDGLNLNPLNGLPYSDQYKKLSSVWSTYPAYNNVEKTIKSIQDNNVILIISGTGSGKTVLIPKFVLHVFDYKKNVAVILPKQILANSSADFAAKTLDVELGVQVGFKHRGEKKYSDETKLLYTTDGTLVAMLMNDPTLKEFDAVIIDEAHERRTDTDFLLYLLKQTCKIRDDFKLVIMSATIEKKIFSDYFSSLKYVDIVISGKTNYPINHRYLDKNIDKSKYLAAGLDKINEILNTTQDGDILFFVPNIQETFEMCKKINNKNVFCVEFYAGMSKHNEELALDKSLYKNKFEGTNRKIIITTNVAESSITFDGITYVIDSGYENFSYYDPKINSKVLDKRMASKAQIKQRCGRTGRTGYGICHHLYTQLKYNELNDYPKPAIQTSNIYSECLNLLAWDAVQTIDKLEKLLAEFIEPPTKEYIDNAKSILLKLKLIENDKITSWGTYIASFPADPMQSIAINAGWKLGCAKEIIAILSFTEVLKYNMGELFYFNKNETDKKKIKKFEDTKNNLYKKNSDHYSILKIFLKYRKLKKSNSNKLNEWMTSNYLKQNLLEKTNIYYEKMRQNCFRILKQNDDQSTHIDTTDIQIKKRVLAALYKGYKLNIALKGGHGYNTKTVQGAKITKESWIINTNKKRILYSEMFSTGDKNYLQVNSTISSGVIELAKKIKP